MKQISLSNLNIFLTEDQIAENKRNIDLRLALGIHYNYDSSGNKQSAVYKDDLLKITNTEFIKISSQYKSLSAYNEDKRKADMMIMKGLNIPDALVSKLVKTRKELEIAGKLKPMQ